MRDNRHPNILLLCAICKNQVSVRYSRLGKNKSKKVSCSPPCRSKLYSLLKPSKYPQVIQQCIICATDIWANNCKEANNARKTCSAECLSIETSRRHKGKPKSLQARYNMSFARTGKRLPPRSIEWRKKMSEANKRRVAEGRHNWYKGGVTPIHKAIRKSIEFKLWREAVFRRDDYRCLDCGERGGELHPDHIQPFAEYPRLRFDIYNGRTLCAYCHKQTLTWGMNTGLRKTTSSYYKETALTRSS